MNPLPLNPARSNFLNAFHVVEKGDQPINPIVIGLRIDPINKIVECGSATGGTFIAYKNITIERDKITVESENNNDKRYVFELLTKNVYDQNKLQDATFPIPNYEQMDDQALQSFFLAQIRNNKV